LKFITENDGTYNVRVTVTDSQGLVATQTLAIVATNTLPTVRLNVLSTASPNITLAAIANDPSPGDQAALTYEWSINGGSFSTPTTNPQFTTSTNGLSSISLRVSDDSGSVTSFIVAGTNGNDTRTITTADITASGSADQFVYLALDGDDNLTIGTGITKPVVAIGGDGNDTIDASLATVRVVLDGGNGDDKLTGGSGDDLLIAGSGTNVLVGGNGKNRFIGGGNDTMTGGIDDDTYEVHFSTVALNDTGAGNDTVDLNAAPAGVTIDFSQTNNTAQQVFPTSNAGDPYFGSTLRLNGSFQTLIGSPFGDNLSASTPGTSLQGGVGNDVLSATGNDINLEGGAGNDQLILTNTSGTVFGGSGNDTVTGTLSNMQTTVLDGGEGDDTWNIVGPSSGNKASVTIIGGAGSNVVNATNLRGKIAAQGTNASGIVSEFGSVRTASTINATVNNSNNVSIFGGSTRNSVIIVNNSNDVGIFGGGGDTITLTGVQRATIEGGLFGGVATNTPLTVSANNSSNVGIFGGTTLSSQLSTAVNNSSNVGIFGGLSSQLAINNSSDVSIYGVSEGSINVNAPVNEISRNVQIRISDFGSAQTSPTLLLTLNNSSDVGIFGSASIRSAPLNATVNNSSNVSIFGSASRNVSLGVNNSTDVGIFGVVDGAIQIGPVDPLDRTAGVAGLSIEAAAAFGGVNANSILTIAVNNSSNVGVFGSSSINSAPLITVVNNSSNVGIFGSVVRGGTIQVNNSTDVGIYAQASQSVDLSRVVRGNIFVETFGSVTVGSQLAITVSGNSTNVGIFGGSIRNSSIAIIDSNDVHIFGGLAVNTIHGVAYVGDSVVFSGVTNSTIASGVFGSSLPSNIVSTVLQATLNNSSDIAIFGSALGTTNVSVISSQDISIYGGYGDAVDLLSVARVRVEGGVFGGAQVGQTGLRASVAGNSTDVGIFGTLVDDLLAIVGGTNIGFDTRAGIDTISISNATNVVGITDAGDDQVTVNSGTNMLLYLAAGIDRASVLGGSNIRVLGAEGNDEFYVSGGSDIGFDGGDGMDSFSSTGGTDLNLRSDSGNDVLVFFSDVAGFISGGDGDDTIRYYGGAGIALSPGKAAAVIDGQAGNDTLEVRPMLSQASRASSNQPDPFLGVPAWLTLPESILNPTLNRLPSSVALIGGTGDDTLYLEGNQRLYGLGGEGNDAITLAAGSNSFAVGGDGNDTISILSSGVDNTVFGDAGNDTITISDGIRLAIFGEQGNDTIDFLGGSRSYARSGFGDDSVTVAGGSDFVVSTEEGYDTINITGGANIVAGGGSESDELTVRGGTNVVLLGESGIDNLKYIGGDKPILSGGDGNDTIEASQRDADLYGDDGDDTYKILPLTSTGTDVQLRLRELQFINTKNFAAESRGIDTIDLSAFSNGAVVDLDVRDTLQSVIVDQVRLYLTGSFESITGTSSDDTLTGNSQNNQIDGRGGNDTIRGLGGNDTLIGGLGDDSLDGGTGDDRYLFGTTSGELLGTDTIYEDTNGGVDEFQFSGLPVGLGMWDMSIATSQSLAAGLIHLIVRKSAADSSAGEIEDVVGTSGGDTIRGNSLDNRFELLGGDDFVDGGDGSDIYVFRGTGLGSDAITDSGTGSNRDTLDFTGLDVPLNLDLAVTTAQPQANAALNAITLTLTDANSIENVVGTSFNDIIRGNARDNALYGGAGSDTLDGRSGNDRIFAGLTAIVLLDFDSAYDALRGDYNYSSSERNAIQTRMQADYAAYDWRFTQSETEARNWTVDSGRSFVRLNFSQGRGGGVSGDAGEVDFRNANRRIVSEVNINALKPLIADLLGPGYTQQAYSEAIVALTTTIASHELGHTAGLRHADSFGPIGSGVYANSDTSRMYPPYAGARNAIETVWHLLASPASVGSSIADAMRDLFFGERESIKLAFDDIGQTRLESSFAINSHSTLASAEDLGTLAQLVVPNNLPTTGFVNSGKLFDVSALAVVGDLKFGTTANSTEVDYYKFTGRGGEVVNVELLANSLLPLRGDAFDGALQIFQADGTLLAENDDDFEGTKDATLVDIPLPVDGVYYIAVSLSSVPALAGQGGRYELFVSRFRAVASGTVLPTSVGDTLFGRDGADVLQGGMADDFFSAAGALASDGADAFFGGPGKDTLDLAGIDYLYTASSIETILNSPITPALTLTGPANAAVGQAITFTAILSNLPAGSSLTMDWGDTTSVSQSASNGTILVNKTYIMPSPAGGFNVTATVRNASGTTLVVKSASIQVSPLLVVEEPGQRVLYGGATMANDAIAVRRISDSQFGIKLSATGSETIYNYGSMGTPVQRLVLYGLDGNDTITIDPLLTLPVSLYGGSGNDVLRGGGGDDIIVGGDGLDQLYGFGGSDLIIGGTGRDTLYGAGDQDIIVAGSTLLDDNLLATQAILKYWTSKSSDMTLAWYQTRVATIRDVGVGSGAWRLNAATTIDDNAIDTIYAAAGVPSGSPRKLNWYLRNTLGTGLRDSLIGGMANEESTDNRNA
jgi:Ca2+-binding RTX toxin-like protein